MTLCSCDLGQSQSDRLLSDAFAGMSGLLPPLTTGWAKPNISYHCLNQRLSSDMPCIIAMHHPKCKLAMLKNTAGITPFKARCIQACTLLLWCSLVQSADKDVQVTVEQQALEDYLLSEPALKAAVSQLLSVRAASPDIVTQVLTQLSSKPPQELWTLIHADAAAGGKPAKAAPAKAPAAAKGKAGELYHLNVTT